MPVVPESTSPANPTADKPRQEPTLHPAPGRSALPASIAGAFAAAQYSLQHSLQQAQEQDPDEQPERPEDHDTGLLPQLYASRIGLRSQAFYLAQFQRFDAIDRALPSWNMAAAFFTLAWCCLRGLWRQAAQYALAVTAVALIWWFGLRPALPPAMALGLGAALWLVCWAVPGLLGNGWYWRKVRAETLQAIAAAPTMAQAHAQLQAQAEPLPQRIAALLVMALPLAAAAGASLALLPTQSDSAVNSAVGSAVNNTATSPAPVIQKIAPPPQAEVQLSAASTSTAPTSATQSSDAETASPSAPSPTTPKAEAISTPPAAESAAPSETAEAAGPAAANLSKSSSGPDAAPATAEPVIPTAAPTHALAPPPAPAPKVAVKAGKTPSPSSPPAAKDNSNSNSNNSASSPALKPGAFYVNAGIYSDPDNASKVVAQLRQAKLPVLTQKFPSNKGELTRVRSGPYDSRSSAERAASKLQALRLETSVFQVSSKSAKP